MSDLTVQHFRALVGAATSANIWKRSTERMFRENPTVANKARMERAQRASAKAHERVRQLDEAGAFKPRP